MFWGLTPALDMLKEYKTLKSEVPETLNILIVGSADCRHVLKTEARKYRHGNVKINFYLVEVCVELIARQLLLLNIALQPQEVVGLSQKTKIFMEIYGNSLVRPSVAKFFKSTASDLIKMITDYDYLRQMMNFACLDIKYKERDYLENLLKFWCSKDEFDICNIWDRRLRKYLGVRYDSKTGAFDWDLHMRLYDIGAKQICNQEYRNFRNNGVAFTWLESEVSKPNRSLVCATIPNGTSFVHHGYLGDMLTGPFITFGLDCEDEKFLKSVHGQNYYRATDVTERNLKQIFYEIEHKQKYIHQFVNDTCMGNVVMKETDMVVDVSGLDFIPRPTKKCLEIDDEINIISISIYNLMRYKEQYRKYFDVVYYANTHLKYLDQELIKNVAKKDAVMFIENQLFFVSNRKKELETYAGSIDEAVDGLDLEKRPFDCLKDSYVKFIIH
ncbi:dynein axonemal assembly factor 3 homolog [Diorhabda carinulata]|uniref:dynein axonemal assembly factor 3 homolog n=1 Tax=Diorhabda carinulata TaxID=1163345 RepID=UPI0025A07F14|nr:dynein axonemal assembly factor 3 homolog [Diorhabda carinulata]